MLKTEEKHDMGIDNPDINDVIHVNLNEGPSPSIWPHQANLELIAYASSEGSGEPAHPRILARTSAARSYKQWVKRNLQIESQIPGPSEWLGMCSWNLSWRNARRHKFTWCGPINIVQGTNSVLKRRDETFCHTDRSKKLVKEQIIVICPLTIVTICRRTNWSYQNSNFLEIIMPIMISSLMQYINFSLWDQLSSLDDQ